MGDDATTNKLFAAKLKQTDGARGRAEVLGLLGEPTQSFVRDGYEGITPTEAFRLAGSELFDFGEGAFEWVDVYVHPTRPRIRYHFAYDGAGGLLQSWKVLVHESRESQV